MIHLGRLIHLLNEHYLNHYKTILVGGFDEPFYKASQGSDLAEIRFTQDYIRSALHELAHWCVAGSERRKTDDFGYWYANDGRNQQQQNEFYKVEIKPQAIEWALSLICGVKFEASIDNLQQQVTGAELFEQQLHQQLKQYCSNGFNKKTRALIQTLANHRRIKKPIIFIQSCLSKA